MTWNILSSKALFNNLPRSYPLENYDKAADQARLQNIIDVINTENADVLLLQEYDTAFHHKWYWNSRLKRQHPSCLYSCFFREAVVGEQKFGHFSTAVCIRKTSPWKKVGGIEKEIIGPTQFISIGLEDGTQSVTVHFGSIHLGLNSAQNDIPKILKKVKENDLIVFGGDFNSDPKYKNYFQPYITEPFADKKCTRVSLNGLPTTMDTRNRLVQYDHIFYSKGKISPPHSSSCKVQPFDQVLPLNKKGKAPSVLTSDHAFVSCEMTLNPGNVTEDGISHGENTGVDAKTNQNSSDLLQRSSVNNGLSVEIIAVIVVAGIVAVGSIIVFVHWIIKKRRNQTSEK